MMSINYTIEPDLSRKESLMLLFEIGKNNKNWDKLANTVVTDLDISGTNNSALSHINFTNITFVNCDFSRCDFSGINLEGVIFSYGCKYTNTTFESCNLSNTEFEF